MESTEKLTADACERAANSLEELVIALRNPKVRKEGPLGLLLGTVGALELPPTSSFASPGLCSDCNRMKDSTAAG